MTPVPVTSFYAAILAVLFVGLSARVIRRRGATAIVLGTGSDALLQRAVRAHANFAEYVPLALLLMMFAELQRLPLPVIHLAGLVLVIARVLHAYGVSRTAEDLRLRVAGIGATLTTIVALAIAVLLRNLLG